MGKLMPKEDANSSESNLERFLNNLIPGIAVLLGLVLGAYVLWFSSQGISTNPSDWGTLGDYFGGLMNPLISFATLLVAYAVWKLQRVELDETKTALKEQADTAERQRREQRFFDLLNVYYRTVDALRFDKTTGGFRSPVYRESFYGKDALRQWFAEQGAIYEFLQDKGQYSKVNDASGADTSNASYLASLRREWEATDKSNRFAALLRTMEMVFSTARLVLTQDQLSYLDLLKAQLSESELSLIGYELLFNVDPSSLRVLVEQLGLLENMGPGDLRSALEDRLPSTAFCARIQGSGYTQIQ
ncbi:MAG TPA: hypothetical protein DEV74_12410 [Acidovorax sp.]|nr:hypothetical protein [Acidovorax sp.]